MEIIKHTYKPTSKLANRHKTTHIILHCAATPEGKDFTTLQIDKWHKDRKFACIGYHYVIYRDGTIVEGRPVKTIGAHAIGYNDKSIGICYVGGVDEKGNVKDTRTTEQKQAMLELVQSLMEEYNITLDKVLMHNQVAAKGCPSFKKSTFDKEFLEFISHS